MSLEEARGIVGAVKQIGQPAAGARGLRGRGPMQMFQDDDERLPWETGGGGGGTGDESTYGRHNKNSGKPGYDINGRPLPTSTLPPGWAINPRTGDLIPPGTDDWAGSDAIPPGEFFEVGDDLYQWNGRTITEASQAERKSFYGGSDPQSSGSSRFDTGPGQLDLARRGFDRDIFEDDRNYGRSIFESDRNFGFDQQQANRGEMGNRAGTALSLGDLLLGLAQRDDQLANDPGNFPAWLAAMQGNTAAGPVVQNLVGQGVAIQPQQNSYLNDPRFKGVLDSLFDYSKVPNSADVDRTQQAYNKDPEAARRWFEAAAALDKGRGMAMGGQIGVRRPMRLQDLTSGETVATMGESGDETVTVTPSEGTARALGKTLGAGGFSFFPADIRAKLNAGQLPQPGELPDWMLAKLPPSIRQLFAALITSRLGGSGAEDYDFTRSLYAARGFDSSTGGVSR